MRAASPSTLPWRSFELRADPSGASARSAIQRHDPRTLYTVGAVSEAARSAGWYASVWLAAEQSYWRR